jgi:hypothetical protein
MRLVPLVGAWDAAGLQGTPKNPMSLALDHDKLVVSLFRFCLYLGFSASLASLALWLWDSFR